MRSSYILGSHIGRALEQARRAAVSHTACNLGADRSTRAHGTMAKRLRLRRSLLALAAAGAATTVEQVDAHGSLTLPVPRNNKGAEPPFGRTIYHNPGCQGDACLWFNEGCYNGCPSCTGAMPNTTQGGSANTYGEPDARSCPSPSEPTLPEQFRTWNIENKSPRGDFTKYHPWRSPGRSPTSDPW